MNILKNVEWTIDITAHVIKTGKEPVFLLAIPQ